jgi:hypothetical protein
MGLLIIKIIELVRFNETLSLQIKLVKKTFNDIISFFVFFCFWVILLSLLYRLTGADLFDREEEDSALETLPILVAQIVMIFRNSFGELQSPYYDFWKDEKLGNYGAFMITIVWICYAVNVILMFVIMMNILIGIVTQSYDEVKDSHVM